jgi:AcrR family transcriptional regulator
VNTIKDPCWYDDPVPPRRLTKAESQARTRARLLKAAEKVFANKGFGAASLDDIAVEAGVTKGAVYSNFASKEELIVTLLSQTPGTMADLSMFDTDMPFADQVRAFGRSVAVQFDAKDTAKQAELIAYAVRNKRAGAVYRQIAHDGLTALGQELDSDAEGLRPSQFSGRDVVAVIDALILGLLLRQAINPELVDDQLLENAIALLICAFVIGVTDADEAIALRLQRDQSQ